MTEIRFYHLMTKRTEEALPQILEKALEKPYRIIIHHNDNDYLKNLNEHLWTYQEKGFLPHGIAPDKHSHNQPIWLTDKSENPNNADMLILTSQTLPENIEEFELCCLMFEDHNTEHVSKARALWAEFKEKNYALTYWKQNEKGGWDKK